MLHCPNIFQWDCSIDQRLISALDDRLNNWTNWNRSWILQWCFSLLINAIFEYMCKRLVKYVLIPPIFKFVLQMYKTHHYQLYVHKFCKRHYCTCRHENWPMDAYKSNIRICKILLKKYFGATHHENSPRDATKFHFWVHAQKRYKNCFITPSLENCTTNV